MILSIGVLAPMGGEIRDVKSLSLGSLLGGGILGLLLAMSNYALLCFIPDVFHREIPQMLIVSKMGSFFVLVYVLLIWAEIFTTAVGNLFSIHTIAGEKFSAASALPQLLWASALLCCTGFNIVSWFYPVMGDGLHCLL